MDPIAERLALPDGSGKVGTTMAWEAVRERLEQAPRHWLVTTRPDGRAHVVPVDGLWLDDAWYDRAGVWALRPDRARPGAPSPPTPPASGSPETPRKRSANGGRLPSRPGHRLGEEPTMEIVACPDPTCPAPAWIEQRWTWPSTAGPLEHVKTGCASGHWFTPTADTLTPFRAPTPVTVVEEVLAR
jgi:hypothetical protein